MWVINPSLCEQYIYSLLLKHNTKVHSQLSIWTVLCPNSIGESLYPSFLNWPARLWVGQTGTCPQWEPLNQAHRETEQMPLCLFYSLSFGYWFNSGMTPQHGKEIISHEPEPNHKRKRSTVSTYLSDNITKIEKWVALAVKSDWGEWEASVEGGDSSLSEWFNPVEAMDTMHIHI